jgi:hypothetical protein
MRSPFFRPLFSWSRLASLKQCIGARTALAGLKEAAQNLPNQALLIQTLPLLEAQASSEIESIVTTTDELFKHPEITESMDPATKEALQYRAALLQGFGMLSQRPLTTDTAGKSAASSRTNP